MKNFLSKLFKKKEDPEVLHYYYGLILTKKKLTVDQSNVISLFSIKESIYPRAEYLFMDYEALIDYIRTHLLDSGHMQPFFAYQVAFRPYIASENRLLKDLMNDSKHTFELSLFNDVDIMVIEDVIQKLIGMNIRSGIQSVEYLYICMRVGYKQFLEEIVWKDFISSCIMYHMNPDVIKVSGERLGKEQVLKIYDKMFKSSDDWDKKFINRLKQILMYK